MKDENTSQNSQGELPVFVKWMQFVQWVFKATEKFPKKVKFTLSDRIINHTLSVVEDLVEARYSRQKLKILNEINTKLEVLRILFRVSYEEKFLSYKSYQYSMRQLNEVGKMIGGWRKQQERR